MGARRLLIPLAVAAVLLLTACAGPASAVPVQAEKSPTAASQSGQNQDQDLKSERAQIRSQFPNAKIPQAKVIKKVTISEWPDAMAACMTAAGFQTTVTKDGGVTGRTPNGQQEANLIATYVCNVEYPLQAKYTKPLDEKQLSALYAYYTITLTRCLAKHGVQVPTPPSLSSFEQTYQSKPWTPYSFVPPSKGEALSRTCPQVPPHPYG